MCENCTDNPVPIQTIKGECYGVNIYDRGKTNPLVELLVEDDGIWHRTNTSFDCSWINDLINSLIGAKAWIIKNNLQSYPPQVTQEDK